MSGQPTQRPPVDHTGMSLFRRRQKLIMSVIAGLVILSFALVWNVDFDPGRYDDYVVAEIRGKVWRSSDRARFKSRLDTAVGAPVQVVREYTPDPYRMRSLTGKIPHYHIQWTDNALDLYLLVLRAREAGVNVSDLEVGTWLRQDNPVLRRGLDGPMSDEEFNRRLDTLAREKQTSRPEIVAGARDWLVLRRYLAMQAATQLESPSTLYTRYAAGDARYVFGVWTFNDREGGMVTARAAWDGKTDAERLAEVGRILRANQNDAAFRSPGRWRFEFLTLPYAAAPQTVWTDEEVAAAHAADAERKDKPLDEVRGEIVAELDREGARAWARRTLRTEVVPALEKLAPKEPGAAWPSAAALAADEALAAFGLVAADTEAALTREALLERADVGADNHLGRLVELFDRDTLLGVNGTTEHFKSGFQSMISRLAARDSLQYAQDFFESDAGVMLVRLVEDVPSAPRVLTPPAVDGAAPERDKELWDLAEGKWFDEEVDRLNREAADAAAAALKADPAQGVEGKAAESRELAYLSMEMEHPDYIALARGGVVGPLPRTEGGYEVLRLDDKQMASWKDFSALPPARKAELGADALAYAPSAVEINIDPQSGQWTWDVVLGAGMKGWLVGTLNTQVRDIEREEETQRRARESAENSPAA